MGDVNNIIYKIITKQYDFCCLCYNTLMEKIVYFDDEVIYYDNYEHYTFKISEILSCVLGEEVSDT